MSIRIAAAADVPVIARLIGVLGYAADTAVTARGFERISTLEDHVVFVSPAEGEPVAWLHAHVVHRLGVAPFTEVAGLVVDETARGRGVGGSLMEAAEAWSCARGVTTLRVRTNSVRLDARDFYGARSYQPIKTQIVFEKRLDERGAS